MVDVSRIAVLGAGDMGHGIAELAALHGFTVALRDVDETSLEQGLARIQESLTRLADGERIPEPAVQQAMARVTSTTALDEAVEGADLVVEAVPEDLDLKRDVLADAQRHAPDEALLASNTSTLRITELAEELHRPGRLVGMHFFNPVMRMDLIELIPGEATEPETVRTTEALADQLDRTHVTLDRDTPGFVTSRLAGAFTKSAIRCLEADLAPKAAIDAAMTREAGFPMGPFHLSDYTGLDVGVHASRYMAKRLGEAYAPTDTQVDLVDQGHLGKKTGQGFYTWEAGRPQVDLDAEDPEAFDPALVLAPVANEAHRLADEGVAPAPTIDLAMRKGAAFPAGPMAWTDEHGPGQVLDALARYRKATGDPLADPSPRLSARVDGPR